MVDGVSHDWLIEVRDSAGAMVATVDEFESFACTIKHLAPGPWSLALPLDTEPARLLLKNGYGVEVRRYGLPIMSGLVIAAEVDTGDGRGLVTVSGLDDLVILADRLASPQPGTAAPPYATTAYDTRSGIAETIIKQYANVNAGPGAVSTRRWPGFTIATDLARGSSVAGTGRWQSAFDLCRELAVAGGLGLRCVSLIFDVYVPVDRTTSVEFSHRRDSLGALKFSHQAPQATFVYCGGGGEGTARTIVEAINSPAIASGWWRRERFRDARDTTDATILAQRALEDLGVDLDTIAVGVDAEVFEVPGCKWGTDYEVGDLVSIVTPWDVTLTRRVEHVTVVMTPDAGTVITPTLGTLCPEADPLIAALAGQNRRLARLETR